MPNPIVIIHSPGSLYILTDVRIPNAEKHAIPPKSIILHAFLNHII